MSQLVVFLRNSSILDGLLHPDSDEKPLQFELKDGGTVLHISAAENASQVSAAPCACKMTVVPRALLNAMTHHMLDPASYFPLIPSHTDGEEPRLSLAMLVSEAESESARPTVKVFARHSGDPDVFQADVILPPDAGVDFDTASVTIQERLCLEDINQHRSVAVIGVGSGGSRIAVDLCLVGVGRIVLVDDDRLELHNICRHVCGLQDIGRLKVDAVRDLIKSYRPHTQVQTVSSQVEASSDNEELKQLMADCDVVIAATDNRASRSFINQFCVENQKVCLYGELHERAQSGDVLVCRPNGPCFACIAGAPTADGQAKTEEVSSEKQGRKLFPAYTPANTIRANIQVGLSSDIAPVSMLLFKVVLLELLKISCPDKIPMEEWRRFDEEVGRVAVFEWTNRHDDLDDPVGHVWEPNSKEAVLRWYSRDYPKDEHCMVCQMVTDL